MALSTIVRARRSERKLHHACTREGRPRGGVSKSLESNLVRSVSRDFSFSSVLPLATFRSTIDLRRIEIGSSETTRDSLACATISFALAELFLFGRITRDRAGRFSSQGKRRLLRRPNGPFSLFLSVERKRERSLFYENSLSPRPPMVRSTDGRRLTGGRRDGHAFYGVS